MGAPSLTGTVLPASTFRSSVSAALALLLALGCRLDRREASDGVSTSDDPVTTTAGQQRGIEIRAVLAHPTYEDGEWVQLRNTGRTDVALGGWTLASGGDPGFVFPSGTTILAGGRLDLGKSLQAHRTGGVRVRLLMDGVRLEHAHDWLALRDSAGRTIDSVYWSASEPDMPLTHRPATPDAP